MTLELSDLGSVLGHCILTVFPLVELPAWLKAKMTLRTLMFAVFQLVSWQSLRSMKIVNFWRFHSTNCWRISLPQEINLAAENGIHNALLWLIVKHTVTFFTVICLAKEVSLYILLFKTAIILLTFNQKLKCFSSTQCLIPSRGKSNCLQFRKSNYSFWNNIEVL